MAAAGWNAAASKTKEKAATKKPSYPGAPVVVEKTGPELPIDIEEDGGLLKFLQLQTVAALEARRFEDTLEFVTELAKQGLQPSRDMRNTISIAYKTIVGRLRDAWRVLAATNVRSSAIQSSIDEKRVKVEEEIIEHCEAVVALVTEHCLKYDKQPQGQVFFLKMAGDYSRYHAELLTGDDRIAKASAAERYYNLALRAAINNSLPPTNVVRLGLVMNHSSLLAEVLGQRQEAIMHAKDGFEAALPLVTSLKNPEYGEATHLMALIRDNWIAWTDADAEQQQRRQLQQQHQQGTSVLDSRSALSGTGRLKGK